MHRCCDRLLIYYGLYDDSLISRFDISAPGIGFDLNTRVISTRIGRIDMSCAHAAVSSQWPLSVYEVLVASLYVGPISVLTESPDPVRLRTRHVESAYYFMTESRLT